MIEIRLKLHFNYTFFDKIKIYYYNNQHVLKFEILKK